VSYYIYADICFKKEELSFANSNVSAVQANNGTVIIKHSVFHKYILTTFLVVTFLFILLLPGVMGKFFAHNDSAMLNSTFTWPHRGWMPVISALVYLLTRTLSLCGEARERHMSNIRLLHYFLPRQLNNLTIVSLQFLVIMLVSSTQSTFVKILHESKQKINVETITRLLQDYENIRQGVGPFYALELCIHCPSVLIFGYFGLVRISQEEYFNPTVLWSIGSIAWSSLTIVHICLLSDTCFQALQVLVPSIRYNILYMCLNCSCCTNESITARFVQ
jgi:hypothetical protein